MTGVTPPNVMSTNPVYPPPSIVMHQQQHSSPMASNPMLFHQSILGQPPQALVPPSLPPGYNRSPSTGHVHHMGGHPPYMTHPPTMPPTGLAPLPNTSNTHHPHNYPSSWR